MPKVLLIDDDPHIYNSFQVNLGDEFEFIHAPDKKTALKFLSDQTVIIDIGVIDYVLPDGDGLELLKHAKSGVRNIPVIYLTAYPSLELSTQALSLDYGADYFLSKPVDLFELKRCILKCVQARGEKQNYNYRSRSSAKSNETKNTKEELEKTRQQRETRLRRLLNLIQSKPNITPRQCWLENWVYPQGKFNAIYNG